MKPFSVSLVYLFYSVSFLWFQADASGNDTDRVALLKFKEGITSDPLGVFGSWNDSAPFCKWPGITCSSRHQRVTSLVLDGKNLFGSVSPYIGNLSFLSLISLRENSLHSGIPQEVGRLFRLQEILLDNNTFEEEIPANLTGCSQLRAISLQGNNLTGRIPSELGSLVKLEELRLRKNNLIGNIPDSLGNLSSLRIFHVTFNNFVGDIPDAMGGLTSLKTFAVGVNQLSGVIPASIFNISSMTGFEVTHNQLNGSLPNSIGLTLPNLQYFGFGENNFIGSIPETLFNATQLEIIDLGFNNFVGQIPITLGNLKNLWRIRLHQNNLGSNSSNDLAFVTSLVNCTKLRILDFGRNNLGGVLPNSVANLSTELNLFYFGDNQITGTIPAGFQNLINLTGLVMHYNLFTGVIPDYFGKFQQLQVLDLTRNRLSGQIPTSLGNLTRLSELYLSENNLEGTVPESLGNLKNLYILAISTNKLRGAIPHQILTLPSLSRELDLSQNSFTGYLPPETGELTSLTKLDVSINNLSGDVPTTIGNCLSLENLDMHDNSFEGSIPSALASLKGLQYLDLSGNKLTGKIPEDLQSIQFLLHLNLSFNDLEGELPTEGVFRNATGLSLVGNSKLCGGVPELNLPKCPKKMKKSKKMIKLAVAIPCTTVFVLLILAFLVHYKRNRSSPALSASLIHLQRSSSASLMMHRIIPKVSYRNLSRATDGFSSSNLIGTGNFGSVYKGILDQIKRPVAVKVLKLEQKGAFKGFIAECKVLMNVRHRNLVKLLTYCSSIDDKLNEFKALVFEFMENGSLEVWLHPATGSKCKRKNLDVLQRLNVAIDVASALHHLHDLCKRPIIHCDLKPSNVVLDNDMVAHVCDFGLARLLSTSNASSQSQFSTTGIRGTIGYAAPEYGMGGTASKEGDVYSFGILLLEMFSGRRPTDEIFKDGLNLHLFVKAALPKKLAHIVDPNLLLAERDSDQEQETKAARKATKEDDENMTEVGIDSSGDDLSNVNSDTYNCLLSVLEIGVICSAESPSLRMSMSTVVSELQLIKNDFLSEADQP